MERMRLVEIDYASVRAELDTGAPTKFNTCFHTEEDAPGFPVPSSLPYAFDRWLPLILESRGIDPSACQVVSLSRSQIATILNAAKSSIHTGELSRAFGEDLKDEVHSAFAGLQFPPEGLFMRLGACSLKDAATAGQLAFAYRRHFEYRPSVNTSGISLGYLLPKRSLNAMISQRPSCKAYIQYMPA